MSTAETCVNQLCNAVRKQIEDIEYFIQKVKSYLAQMKTGGQNEDLTRSCEYRMVTTERRICTQLIFISRVCIHLGNAALPLGPNMDNFTKLLIQFYMCLANLTKHLINRQKTLPVSYKSTRFDQLVQTIGKKLPLKVYAMINYIEDNIFDEDNDDAALKKNGAKNNKAKVMRDTKNIPKLILRIENFNKFVISLSKKTEHDLNKLLHMGTVRDFRIKTSALREAIEKFRENEPSDEEELDAEADSDIDLSQETDAAPVTPNSSALSSSNTGSTGSIINELQHDTSLRTSVMKNLNAINKRANKRKKQDTENHTDEVESDNQRGKKKRKENEKIEKPPAVEATVNTRRSNRRITSK